MFCVVFNGPVNWLIILSPLALQPQASKILRKGEEKCLPQLSFLVDPLFFLLMTVVFLLVFLPDSIWFWRFFKEFLTNCLLQAKFIPSLLVASCTKRSENFSRCKFGGLVISTWTTSSARRLLVYLLWFVFSHRKCFHSFREICIRLLWLSLLSILNIRQPSEEKECSFVGYSL